MFRAHLRKLIMFLLWIPLFLLVQFIARVLTSPETARSFGILEVLIAVAVTVAIYLIAERVVVGHWPEGHFEPAMKILIAITIVVAFGLAIYIGKDDYDSNHKPPDVEYERTRAQMRDIERMMRESKSSVNEVVNEQQRRRADQEREKRARSAATSQAVGK